MDRRRQPPLMVMPDALADLPEHVLHRIEGGRPIDLGFEPLPEALDRERAQWWGDPGVHWA